jgi:hypothetical protein
MQKGTIKLRLNLDSAFPDFQLSEFLENTFFEGAWVQEHRANSIPTKLRKGETFIGSHRV